MRTRRSAFTLPELLVVIVIIALLIGLLMPAVGAAVRRAREAAVLTEANNIGGALAAFRGAHGVYPPSRVVVSESGDYSPQYFRRVLPQADAALAVALTPRSVTALRSVFPRLTFKTNEVAPGVPPAPFASANPPPGVCYDVNGNGRPDPPYVLEGDQCLVLFLGGVPKAAGNGFGLTGFSRDPRNPFQSDLLGRNRTARSYAFNDARVGLYTGGRVGPLYDAARFPSYSDGFSGTPFAYFASDGSGYDPDDVGFPAELLNSNTVPVGEAFYSRSGPVPGKVVSLAPNPYTLGYPLPASGTTWLRPDSFQLVTAGADGVYGVGGTFDADAATPLPYDPASASQRTGFGPALLENARACEVDNLTSFHGHRLGN